MNKKLLAAAVAAAVAAPAFADSANVEIYGRLNVGVYHATADDFKTNTGVDDIGSRIGFRGEEKLGNGLSGIWQIESRIKASEATSSTSGSSGWAGRNTFVGLKGSFGQVRIGRIDSLYKSIAEEIDFSESGSDYFWKPEVVGSGIGGSANSFGLGDTGLLGNRDGNTIRFDSANYNGFKFGAQVSFRGEKNNVVSVANSATTANDERNRRIERAKNYYLSGEYEAGNLWVGAVYGVAQDVEGRTDDEKSWLISSTYGIGDFTLGAQIERNKLASNKQTRYSLTGDYKFGNSHVYAIYQKAREDSLDLNEARNYGVGFGYSLSKRTSTYAEYTSYKDETRDKKVDGRLIIGVKHKF